jgi:hypothetical protein
MVVVTIIIVGKISIINPVIINTIPKTFFFCLNTLKLNVNKIIPPKNSRIINRIKTTFTILLLHK